MAAPDRRPSSRECLERVRAGLRKHETDRVLAVRRGPVAPGPAPALSFPALVDAREVASAAAAPASPPG